MHLSIYSFQLPASDLFKLPCVHSPPLQKRNKGYTPPEQIIFLLLPHIHWPSLDRSITFELLHYPCLGLLLVAHIWRTLILLFFFLNPSILTYKWVFYKSSTIILPGFLFIYFSSFHLALLIQSTEDKRLFLYFIISSFLQILSYYICMHVIRSMPFLLISAAFSLVPKISTIELFSIGSVGYRNYYY